MVKEPLSAIFSVLVFRFSFAGCGQVQQQKNQRGRIEKNALPLFCYAGQE